MIIKKRNSLQIEVSSKIGFNNIIMIDIKAAYSGYTCVKFAETSSTRLVIWFTQKTVNNWHTCNNGFISLIKYSFE